MASLLQALAHSVAEELLPEGSVLDFAEARKVNTCGSLLLFGGYGGLTEFSQN